MSKSICGIDCSKCELNNTCGGCVKTNGSPFGSECIVARCCLANGNKTCESCNGDLCELKEKLIKEFNELDIKGLKEVTSLNNVKGSFINIPYTLSNGEVIKLWDDNKIYLANQIKKQDSDRFYGLAADEEYLAVCEYGSMGEDAKIIIFKRYKNI